MYRISFNVSFESIVRRKDELATGAARVRSSAFFHPTAAVGLRWNSCAIHG
jgi:hypothetical protein